jgi:hypothetical protein
MSRNRLLTKVRKNPDYEAVARHLDGMGISHRVGYPNGRISGHPAVFIALPDGGEVPFTIASTPSAWISKAACVRRLKKMLAEHGVTC